MTNSLPLAPRMTGPHTTASTDTRRPPGRSMGWLSRRGLIAAGVVIGGIAVGTTSPVMAASPALGCPSEISDPVNRYMADEGIIEILGARQHSLSCSDGTGDILDPTNRQYAELCIVEFPGVECSW